MGWRHLRHGEPQPYRIVLSAGDGDTGTGTLGWEHCRHVMYQNVRTGPSVVNGEPPSTVCPTSGYMTEH